MSTQRKHLIRRLARMTGVKAIRIALASRRQPMADIARAVLARAYPNGVEA